MLQLIRGQGEKTLEDYREDGIYIEANVNEEVYRKLEKYIVK